MLQSTKLCIEGELVIPIPSLSVKNINVIDIYKVDYQNKSFVVRQCMYDQGCGSTHQGRADFAIHWISNWTNH